jgi:hypothetical protein
MPKFGKDNQPPKENRSGGPKGTTRLLREELDKAFANGHEEHKSFESWLVYKALADGGIFMEAILRRVLPMSKATYEAVEFTYDPNWSALEKADKIMQSIAAGDIPPDVGVTLIEGVNKMLGIEEVTELAKRLEAIEKLLESK